MKDERCVIDWLLPEPIRLLICMYACCTCFRVEVLDSSVYLVYKIWSAKLSSYRALHNDSTHSDGRISDTTPAPLILRHT